VTDVEKTSNFRYSKRKKSQRPQQRSFESNWLLQKAGSPCWEKFLAKEHPSILDCSNNKMDIHFSQILLKLDKKNSKLRILILLLEKAFHTTSTQPSILSGSIVFWFEKIIFLIESFRSISFNEKYFMLFLYINVFSPVICKGLEFEGVALGWRGQTCVKSLPLVGMEVCTKFGGDWYGGLRVKEGHR